MSEETTQIKAELAGAQERIEQLAQELAENKQAIKGLLSRFAEVQKDAIKTRTSVARVIDLADSEVVARAEQGAHDLSARYQKLLVQMTIITELIQQVSRMDQKKRPAPVGDMAVTIVRALDFGEKWFDARQDWLMQDWIKEIGTLARHPERFPGGVSGMSHAN